MKCELLNNTGAFMRNLLKVFLFLLLIGQVVPAAQIETLTLLQEKDIYGDGDVVKVQLNNWNAGETIKRVVIIKQNHVRADNIRPEVIDVTDYNLSSDGLLEINLDMLDYNDNWVTFVVWSDTKIYDYGSQTFHVQSKKDELLSVKGASANFDISDNDGGTFDVDDQMDISGDGFDASENIELEKFQQFDSDYNLLSSTTPSSGGVSVDASGLISGSAVRDGSAFDANAVYINYTVYGGNTSGTVNSNNYLSVTETDPPDFVSARALTQTTIEVTFNEVVTTPATEADCMNNWAVTYNSTSYTVSGFSPVGSTGTSVCTLTVSTALERGATPSIGFTTGTDEFEDAAGNDAASTTTDVVATDEIVPGTLFLYLNNDQNLLTVDDFIGQTTIQLYAHVVDGNTDTSIDGVLFQGSDDGSTWTDIGTGTTGTQLGTSDSASFNISWNSSTTQFRMLRAIAFDDAGADGADGAFDSDDNYTVSTPIGSASDGVNNNFKDSYRIIITNITPTSLTAGSGSSRATITYQMQDNYGNQVNTLSYASYYGFDDGNNGGTWWDDLNSATILSVDGDYHKDTLAEGVTEANVYYSNDSTGSYTISVTQINAGEALSDDSDSYGTPITVSAGSFDHFEVALEVAGNKAADTPFNVVITAKDASGNTITDYSATDIDVFSNATAAPDATEPTIGGDATPTDRSADSTGVYLWDVGSLTFSSGQVTVSCALPLAQAGVWISAEEDEGTYDGSRDYGTGDFTVTHGAVADLVLAGSGESELESIAFGTGYTVTAKDTYENTVTTYASDVTMSVTSGSGTEDVGGLTGAGGDVIAGTSFVAGVASFENMYVTVTDGDASGVYTIHASDGSVSSASDLSVTITRRTAAVSNFSPSAAAHVNALNTPSDLTLSCDISLDEEATLSDDYEIYYKFSNTAGDVSSPTASGDLTYSSGSVSYTIAGGNLASNSSYAYLNWYVANASANSDATLLTGGGTSNVVTLVINPGVTISPVGGTNGDISGGGFAVDSDNGAVSFSMTTDETNAVVALTRVSVSLSGSYETSDITELRIYRDLGTTGALDGSDVQLGSATVSATEPVTVPIYLDANENLTNSGTNFIISVVTSATADGSRTLRIFIQNDATVIGFYNAYVNGGDQSYYGRTFSPDANIGLSSDVSLPVELALFEAESGYGKITLNWITASEVNNAGFYIYRANEESGSFTQITSAMIPGSGNSNVEHTYSYVDEDVEEGKAYSYKLVSVDNDGTLNYYDLVATAEVLEVPRTFALNQNYPNPFNPTTYFNFSVPKAGNVSLIVYNALGQEVARILDNRYLDVGDYKGVFSWDGKNSSGSQVASGIYFYRLISHDYHFSKTMKMLLLK